VRLVLDTNAAISGLLWQGNPGKLIDAAHAERVTLHTSAQLLVELRNVLHREKFSRAIRALALSATEIVEGYAALAIVVVPAVIPPTVIADPDDDVVLACAVAAEADYVVSGDPHLLNLQQFQSIPIVTPAQAVEQLAI
jgi:putative PIN family toxin of toxin-antitoxin system